MASINQTLLSLPFAQALDNGEVIAGNVTINLVGTSAPSLVSSDSSAGSVSFGSSGDAVITLQFGIPVTLTGITNPATGPLLAFASFSNGDSGGSWDNGPFSHGSNSLDIEIPANTNFYLRAQSGGATGSGTATLVTNAGSYDIGLTAT